MLVTRVLIDSFDRVAEELPTVLQGLSPDQLLWRPTAEANSIGWLAWHIARCEDAQMAPLPVRPLATDVAATAAPGAMADPVTVVATASMVRAAESAEQSQQGENPAGAAGEVWTTNGWYERFDLPYPPEAIGYGQTSVEVAAFDVTDRELLTGYYAAVHEATAHILEGLTEDDFDRVVDSNWDPPVTLGARVVSVVNDITQHLGQITYVRGILPTDV